MQRTGSSQNRPRSVPNRSDGQRCKYAEKTYEYKYDLAQSFHQCGCSIVVTSCTERKRVCVRERERGCCLLIVTAAACGNEEDERSLPLRFLDCVFLSIVVSFTACGLSRFFPPLWVFHVTYCVLILFLFFSVYFVHTFYTRLWPNVLVD